MAALVIEHTEAQGTLLVGTSRGDGSAEVVKALGWRWGRSIGLWFVPRSRDAAPKRALIERTAERLREAGFEVEVSVDAATGDREEQEARRVAQSEQRAQAVSGRAEREESRSEARWEAGRSLAERIPFGQPILMGHHSQRSAERDRGRIARHMDASLEHAERAAAARQGAASAAAAEAARNSPVTVARRIDRLQAQIRSEERSLMHSVARGDDPQGLYRLGLEDRLGIARADLAHWEAVRAAQVESGAATAYGPGTVRPGDLVKIRGRWREVVRSNPKTVTVTSDYSWTDRAPWHEVEDHSAAPVAGERSGS